MNFTINNEQEEIVMKLLHYFITTKDYNPVVLHGAKNEIWLENLNSDYKIIRIVSNYIHNDEQLNFDIYRTKQIMKSIRKKTFSFKVPTLSIFLNLGDNVNLKENDYDFIKCLNVKNIDDIAKSNSLLEIFPDIDKNLDYKEEGMELFMKLTGEINKKTEDDAVKAENIFKVKKPTVTYSLIIINILVFVLIYLFKVYTIYAYGVNVRFATLELHQYYRLLTTCFIHGNLVDFFPSFLHLFFNCYALYYIGNQIENFYGKTKYLIVYLGSGIIGSLLSLCFHHHISVGASGAIFGLFGSLLYFGHHYRLYLGTTLRSHAMLVIALNLIIGFTDVRIDNYGHIGGLIGGILLSMACGVKYKSTKSNMINGIILTLLFIIFMLFLLSRV